MHTSSCEKAYNTLFNLFNRTAFPYQREWHKRSEMVRHITKTRCCGADWAFVLEALLDALSTGEDQIFISDDGPLDVSYHYFRGFMEETGLINLSTLPDTIDGHLALRFDNGAQIAFINGDVPLSGFSGHIYVPEYAWCKNPLRLIYIADCLARNKRWRRTYYTTPSDNFDALRAYTSIRDGHPDAFYQVFTADEMQRFPQSRNQLPDIASLQKTYEDKYFRMAYMAEWPEFAEAGC